MRWILLTINWQGALLGHLAIALLFICGAVKRLRYEPTGIIVANWRTWAGKLWPYSTTFGLRMAIYQEHHLHEPMNGDFGRVQEHEHVHVRQGEDYALLGLVMACVAVWVDPWLALGLAASTPLYFLPAFLTAKFRHGTFYRNSEHERSAYAQTDGHPNSWLQRRRDSSESSGA